MPEAVLSEYPEARIIDRSDLIVDVSDELEKLPLSVQVRAREQTNVLDGLLSDFALAREAARQAASHEWNLWIDSDDEIVEANPGELREVFETQFAEDENRVSVFLDYHYEKSPDGATTVFLRRERLFRRDLHEWKGVCHETLLPSVSGPELERFLEGVVYSPDLQCSVHHQTKPKTDAFQADLRNHLVLKREILKQEAENPPLADIRLYYYYANACVGLRMRDEALRCYRITREHSGSQADVVMAMVNAAKSYLWPEDMRPVQAKDYAWEIVKVAPEDPRGWLFLQACDFYMRQFKQSLFWFSAAQQVGEPKFGAHAFCPEEIHTTPYVLAGQALMETDGDVEEIIACAKHLKKRRPDSPEVQAVVKEMMNYASGVNLSQAVRTVALNKAGADCDAITLRRIFSDVTEDFQAVPPQLRDEALGVLEPTFEVQAPRIDFWCGKSSDEWGCVSATTGLAGSERAVWEMAKRLSSRGVRVGIYSNVPREERGVTWDKGGGAGVEWKHYSEFDYEIDRDIVVFWRNVGMVQFPIVARKKFLWCHDVQSHMSWQKARGRLWNLDGAFFLSEYHRSTLPSWVEQEHPGKIILSRNGIDSKLLGQYLEKAEKVPGRVIFTSSPDRGLLTAMRAFNSARTAFPDAELHAFYGFQKLFWDQAAKHWSMHLPDTGRDIWTEDYQRLIHREMQQGGGKIFFHGRVGWSEMAYWLATAGVWFYPTTFDEISCISAMEAQAANCIVCSTDKAALAETIRWDDPGAIRIDRDAKGRPVAPEAKLMLALEKAREGFPDRSEYREAQDWDGVAEQWLQVMGITEACLSS